MTQDGDAAGRKTRGEALSEASQLLVGLSAEVRQLRSVRRLQDEIDAARAAAGG